MDYIASVVGEITQHIKNILNVSASMDEKIYLGKSNIDHMQARHPLDFEKYGQYISSILSAPDFVGINRSDNSIEYVKEFTVDSAFVKVAVRISAGNKYYARSLLYVLNAKRVHNFIRKGTLKQV